MRSTTGMRRAIAAFALFGALAAPSVVLAAASSAAPGNDGSPPPGQGQAGEVGAQNGTGAGSGAFGAYAHGGIPSAYPNPHDRATDGYQTGLNNSALAGNRQGNLP